MDFHRVVRFMVAHKFFCKFFWILIAGYWGCARLQPAPSQPHSGSSLAEHRSSGTGLGTPSANGAKSETKSAIALADLWRQLKPGSLRRL
jgi:hypothetical protein